MNTFIHSKILIEHLLHVTGCVRCGNTGEQARTLVPAWPVLVSRKMLSAEATARWHSPVVQVPMGSLQDSGSALQCNLMQTGRLKSKQSGWS